LALRVRDLEQARQLAATLPEADTYAFFGAISQARLELAAGQPAYALDYLARAWQALEPTDLVSVRLQVLVLEAIARRARGQSQQAQAVFERALAMAQPGGFIRTFVDEGAPLLELLRRSITHGAAATGPLAAYAQRLLAAWADPAATGVALTLTRRERQILALLAAGLSNRAIATQLVVAETTLKRHVSNLYLKLNVHSRTQAVARANELQLL
jgi:LuxR family maltose regulon positive regulatory protein